MEKQVQNKDGQGKTTRSTNLGLLTSIDNKIHGRYTNEDLIRERGRIQRLLDEASNLYDLYVNSRSPYEEESASLINKKLYEEIDAQFKILRSSSENNAQEEDVYNELYERYSKLYYAYETVKDETTNIVYNLSDYDKNAGMIRLCKNVRIMEDIINKICENNIDKSIIGGDRHFDSIRHGFEWLFCHEDLSIDGTSQSGDSDSQERKHMDIRDSNRYLDYVKYQIMVASKYADHSYKSAEEIDALFDRIRYTFENQSYLDRCKAIQAFKEQTKELIGVFFEIYECLVNYRDALFHEEEIRKSLEETATPDLTEIELDSDKIIKIINLSSISVRVLIDRFVSFVKINDLNFGNSTFKRAWFNYSELSKSNYSGSDFKYARIENARMKDCDISTCNFTLADGGNTDFSRSNFTYSNLCGMNLIGAVLNHCELQNVSFTDPNISSYKEGFKSILPKREDGDNKRTMPWTLIDTWKNESYLYNGTPSQKQADIINEVKSLPVEKLTLPSENASLPVLLYKNESVANIGSTINALAQQKLSQRISKEFVNIVRKMELAQKRGGIKYKNRIRDHGKVYLDAANLNCASVKYSQINGNDLSLLAMIQASFENTDMSGATMFYADAKSASFIFSNLNHVDSFESNFYLANFASAVMNDSWFINCNLDHTNWNKAILISSMIADFSRFRSSILEGKNGTLELCTNQNISFEPDNNLNYSVILDKADYKPTENDAAALDENWLWQNRCQLNDSSFIDAIADRAVFINMTADRTAFNHASMKNVFWFNCRTFLADYIETDFRYSYLSFCCMGQSNFTSANMTSMYLRYVDFSNCNLYSALFNLSSLDHVLFTNANTRIMNLSGASIKNSAFCNCAFDSVNLTNTTFDTCVFSHIDFSSLIGFGSTTFKNCFFEYCTYKSRNKSKPISSDEDLRALIGT